MSTLSVPLDAALENFVNGMVRRGEAANKADVARRALLRMAEDEAVQAVLDAEQEMREGKILSTALEDAILAWKQPLIRIIKKRTFAGVLVGSQTIPKEGAE